MAGVSDPRSLQSQHIFHLTNLRPLSALYKLHIGIDLSISIDIDINIYLQILKLLSNQAGEMVAEGIKLEDKIQSTTSVSNVRHSALCSEINPFLQ